MLRPRIDEVAAGTAFAKSRSPSTAFMAACAFVFRGEYAAENGMYPERRKEIRRKTRWTRNAFGRRGPSLKADVRFSLANHLGQAGGPGSDRVAQTIREVPGNKSRLDGPRPTGPGFSGCDTGRGVGKQ